MFLLIKLLRLKDMEILDLCITKALVLRLCYVLKMYLDTQNCVKCL